MLNGLDAVHGGVHPFLADVCTSIALSAVHPGSSISVSVAMTVEYADAAKLGDTLYIVSKVNKAGGRLAYITYEILCSKTGSDEERRIVATGSHTKYVLKNKM
ncbi:HotDog domain-containing protein [Entophlyctis helioformis]|nr:HotDog domain-containing protein [Entophlyctis helioformis]